MLLLEQKQILQKKKNIYIYIHIYMYIVQTVTKQWISNSSTCIRFNDLIHIKCVHQIWTCNPATFLYIISCGKCVYAIHIIQDLNGIQLSC